jgi:two-component system, response regulator, stage 0 sporulation protein A
MSHWKVLLADDNKSFLELLASRICAEEEFEVVCTAIDGEEALNGIQEYKPDVVVLDIIMPKLDGIGVQEKLLQLPDKPKVIIFSALGMDYITRQALALGADAYFLKPFNLDVFIKRLRMLMGETREQQQSRSDRLSEEELDRRITEMLHKLAVAPHLKGYRYIKQAVIYVVNDKGMLDSITYKIYPSIAERFKTKPARVERAIRSAIENAWDRCRVETMEEVFGYSLDENKGKPSNSAFIALVADKVMLDKGTSGLL